jgi:3-hydroxybutyryl-CoA dehydratase
MKLNHDKGAASSLLKRQTKIGKKIEELTIGEKLHITETITDKDLLLYLGLTNDNNPLYIQHDYAQLTPYEKPIVPNILLMGIITSAISKHLPGPGSHIKEQHLSFLTPVFHDETISFDFQITEISLQELTVKIRVEGFNDEQLAIVTGELIVSPPNMR